MPNLKYLRPLLPYAKLDLRPIVLLMLTSAAWAQTPNTLTVTDVLRQQQTALTPPVLKIARAKTTVSLDAVYGVNDQLKFDVRINGIAKAGQIIGNTVKGSAGSCTIASYNASSQCLQLTQDSRSEICPAEACWTGVRSPITPLPSTSHTVIPAISNLLPPPSPIARPASGGVMSIAPVAIPVIPAASSAAKAPGGNP